MSSAKHGTKKELEQRKKDLYDKVYDIKQKYGEQLYEHHVLPKPLSNDELQGIETSSLEIKRVLSEIIKNHSLGVGELATLVHDSYPVNGLELIEDANLRAKVLEKIIMQGRKDKENGMAFGDCPSLVAKWMNSIENDQKRTRLIGKLESQDLLNFLKQDFTQLDKLQKVENRMPELFSNSAEADGKDKQWKNNSKKLERITYAFENTHDNDFKIKADILNHVTGLKDIDDNSVGIGKAQELSLSFLSKELKKEERGIENDHIQKVCKLCNSNTMSILLQSDEKYLGCLLRSVSAEDIIRGVNCKEFEFSPERFIQIMEITKELDPDSCRKVYNGCKDFLEELNMRGDEKAYEICSLLVEGKPKLKSSQQLGKGKQEVYIEGINPQNIDSNIKVDNKPRSVFNLFRQMY